MADYYHIYVSPKPGVTRAQVENLLNSAIDWYRYDEKNWILYTSSPARTWYSRLQPVIAPGGYVFICKLSLEDYFGFMPKGLWDWVQGPKGKDRGA